MTIMKMKRNKGLLKKMSKQEDCFVDLPRRELLAFMWELTSEIWSLQGNKNVERRLQRNVANFVKR